MCIDACILTWKYLKRAELEKLKKKPNPKL